MRVFGDLNCGLCTTASLRLRIEMENLVHVADPRPPSAVQIHVNAGRSDSDGVMLI